MYTFFVNKTQGFLCSAGCCLKTDCCRVLITINDSITLKKSRSLLIIMLVLPVWELETLFCCRWSELLQLQIHGLHCVRADSVYAESQGRRCLHRSSTTTAARPASGSERLGSPTVKSTYCWRKWGRIEGWLWVCMLRYDSRSLFWLFEFTIFCYFMSISFCLFINDSNRTTDKSKNLFISGFSEETGWLN